MFGRYKGLLMASILVLLAGCGEKLDEAAQALKNVQDIASSSDEMQAHQNAIDKRRAERREKGDTLALAPDALKAYLPASISGYTAAEPETQSVEVPGMSWTIASREYRKDNASIKVTLTDYNASEGGWAAASALFSMKWSVDNANEMQKSFQTGNDLINGFERYGKKDQTAAVTYALGGRLLLQLEATGQSGTDLLKSVADGMSLQKLAGL